MNKIYQRIDWENYPSSATPLNEDNLNKMDYAIDKLDDRIVTHETTKLDTATGNTLVKNVTFTEKTGVFTIEKLSGSKITINTALEKISTNFHFNPTTQKLILTLIDGTTQEIDLSALLTQYEFLESDTITFEIDANGKVKANILNGSITGEKLEPNYLANVTLQAKNAKTSADNAKTSEQLAYQYAEEAKESASQTAKSDAKNITYDNTESGLSATNVKDALDEVAQCSVSAIAIDTTITDSTNAPLVSLKVKGKTEQFTTSGKNLLDTSGLVEATKNGIVYTPVYKDGLLQYINCNGTNTSAESLFVLYSQDNSIPDKLEKGVEYIASVNSTGNVNIQIYEYINGAWINILTTKTSQSFVISENAIELMIRLQVLAQGTSVSNVKCYPMIRLASITDDTYEPYTGGIASPNPDYPQEINGLAKDGAIEVKTCGKNIFGGLALAQALVDSGSTNVVLDESVKTVAFKQNTNYQDENKKVLFSDFKENTQYTIILSGKCDEPNTYNTNLMIRYTDDTYNWIGLTDNTDKMHIAKTDANKTVSVIEYNYAASYQTTLHYEQCGVFEGVITADEFTPYQGETAAAIPTDAPLYKGDYLEIYADGSGKLVRNIRAGIVAIGSTVTLQNGLVGGIAYASDKHKDSAKVSYSYCDKATREYAYTASITTGMYYVNPENFVFVGTAEDTLGTLKAKYDGAKLIYYLAEPTETPLTAEQVAEFKKLYTFEPVTNIFCDGEMEIQYYKNTDSGRAVGTVHRMANDEKATYDGDGNVITSTYATKEDLENFDNSVELTKAEYDALPNDKLTNNIIYFIKDM